MHFQVLQVNLWDLWRQVVWSMGVQPQPHVTSCSVRTRTRTRPFSCTNAFCIFTPQSEQWSIREQYFSRKQANTRISNEIYHAKHTQNGFNPKPDIQLTSFTTIPVPCLRLHRSWEALVPRPLRQKPTFLIATRCGKTCEMANPAWLVTVKTPILGCITNLMKSTHWKPVNIVNVQNVQLGFMLTTSLVEARLSVMSTLGSRQERSSHRRHKKKYTTA